MLIPDLHDDDSGVIDPRVGIVRGIDSDEIPSHFPSSFRMTTAALSDALQFGPWPADSAGAGCSLVSDRRAREAALGEAIERYCGNLVPAGLPRASLHDLQSQSVPALDPREAILFTADQYNSSLFPFVPSIPSQLLEWTIARNLSTGQAIHVPAALVWAAYPLQARSRGEAVISPVIQAGLAAGRTRDFARMSALLEIIERDTVSLCWHGRGGIRRIPAPPHLIEYLRDTGVDIEFLQFRNEFGVPVVGALVRDKQQQFMTLGTAARPTLAAAAEKSLTEALQLQLFTAVMGNPDSAYMRIAESPESPLKRWRADRRYLYDCHPLFADVVDYTAHVQIYLDTRLQKRFTEELEVALSQTEWSPDDQTSAVSIGGPTDLVERLARAGHDVLEVDVTTEDVHPQGYHVVRVLVPGMYTNTAVGLPFRGGGRMAHSLAGAEYRALPLPQ